MSLAGGNDDSRGPRGTRQGVWFILSHWRTMNGYGQGIRLTHVMYYIALLSTKPSFLREAAHPG